MPFDSESGKLAGQKSRSNPWKNKNPIRRDKKLLVRFTAEEMEYLSNLANINGISMNEMVIRAVMRFGGNK